MRAFHRGAVDTDEIGAPRPALGTSDGEPASSSADAARFAGIELSIQAITGSFGGGILTVIGDSADNGIVFSRDAAGNILVNGGDVPVAGGTPTVANTVLIQASGLDGNDIIALDESNGALWTRCSSTARTPARISTSPRTASACGSSATSPAPRWTATMSSASHSTPSGGPTPSS